MPRPRIELGDLLRELCENIYYQPPVSIRMKYPAILYSLNRIRNRHADNGVYLQSNEYTITVIDKDPDSKIVKQVSQLPKIQWDRNYISENLYHTVFTMNY